MIADVILGNNIDTFMWIKELRETGAENIIVLDYEYYEWRKVMEGIIYISSHEIKDYLSQFDSVCFYKSLYVYPGMGGEMSKLYKK